MLKRIAAIWVFALLGLPFANAAITATTTHYVRTDGAAGNGGCYDPSVGVPGTNYSDQATTQISFTDLVIGADELTATSVLNPITSAMVGNCFNVTAGATCTVQRVVLLSQAAGVGTFSTDLGTVGGACTAAMGGARGAGIQAAEASVIAGNTVYVKATANYDITATQTYSTAGTANAPIRYIGYTSTITDGGQATVNRTSGTITAFNITGVYRSFQNLIVTNAISKGFSIVANFTTLINCKVNAFTSMGFDIVGTGDRVVLINCWANAGTSAASAGYSVSGSCIDVKMFGCVATAGQCAGFLDASSATGTTSAYIRCIAANHTSGGASAADGFRFTAASLAAMVNGCVSYNNGGNGILFSGANTADFAAVTNTALVSNGAYGINSDTTVYTLSQLMMNYNAFYNNTSGARLNVPTGANDVALSGDPFTSSTNFLPISSGAGLQLAAGFPGILQAGGTGALYIGALQPAVGTGGGQKGFTWVARAIEREMLRLKSNPEMWAMIHPEFSVPLFPTPNLPASAAFLAVLVVGIAFRKR